MKRVLFALTFLFFWVPPSFAQEVSDTTVSVAEPAPELKVEVLDMTVTPPLDPAPVVDEGDGIVPSPETVPETPAQVGAVLDKAIAAAQGGQWTAFAGLLIMILIWILRRFGALAKWKASVPWLALVVGGAAVYGGYLATGYSMGDAALYAFFSGGQAIVFWELVFKHLDRKYPAKEKDEPST